MKTFAFPPPGLLAPMAALLGLLMGPTDALAQQQNNAGFGVLKDTVNASALSGDPYCLGVAASLSHIYVSGSGTGST